MTQQQLSYLTQVILIALLKSSQLVIRRSPAGVCENHPSDDLVAWKSQSWAFEVFIFMSSLEDVTSRSCQKEVVLLFFFCCCCSDRTAPAKATSGRKVYLTHSFRRVQCHYSHYGHHSHHRRAGRAGRQEYHEATLHQQSGNRENRKWGHKIPKPPSS